MSFDPSVGGQTRNKRTGSGWIQYSFTLPEEAVAILDGVCAKSQISRADLLRRMVAYALEDMGHQVPQSLIQGPKRGRPALS